MELKIFVDGTRVSVCFFLTIGFIFFYSQIMTVGGAHLSDGLGNYPAIDFGKSIHSYG